MSKASSTKRVSVVQHWNNNRSSVDRKIQLQCESSRIGESNRLPPILGLDDIKCVELVGSLHYFAPSGFSAHVPRHCPLFSKRRFKELQVPNTAIRFIRLFQNSPVNFYVKWGAFRKRSSLALTFLFLFFIFFWKTMWYDILKGIFLLFFRAYTNARAEVSPRDLMWKTKRALKLNKIHPLPGATLRTFEKWLRENHNRDVSSKNWLLNQRWKYVQTTGIYCI